MTGRHVWDPRPIRQSLLRRGQLTRLTSPAVGLVRLILNLQLRLRHGLAVMFCLRACHRSFVLCRSTLRTVKVMKSESMRSEIGILSLSRLLLQAEVPLLLPWCLSKAATEVIVLCQVCIPCRCELFVPGLQGAHSVGLCPQDRTWALRTASSTM